MAEYRLSAAAARDLDGIFDYTAAQWGQGQAVQYTETLRDACAALAETPTKGRDSGHIRAGYRCQVVEHHVVYFRPMPYGVAVIRILHERMDAPRHL
jgi:toxin ParE1/3/4